MILDPQEEKGRKVNEKHASVISPFLVDRERCLKAVESKNQLDQAFESDTKLSIVSQVPKP